MGLHKVYGIVTQELANKLTRVRGGWGLLDIAEGTPEERQKWFQTSGAQKARLETRCYVEGEDIDIPVLGGWRSVRIKFKANHPCDLIGKKVIVDLCTEKPKQPHPVLGEVPRWIIYLREMTGPSERVIRLVDIWRNEDDALFELPEEKGQYGRFFWSHSLSMFKDHGERQYPRLVVYHPMLPEVRPDGYSDDEKTIEQEIEKLKNE